MPAYIQRPDGTALYFDLTYDERHSGSAMITKYPVEDGPDISDHVRVEPTPFTMRCFISNTPLVPSGNQAGTKPGLTEGSVKSAVLVKVEPYKAPFGLGTIVSAAINPVGAIVGALSGDGNNSYSMPVLMFPQDFDAPAEALFILQDMQEKAELLTVFTSLAEYENMILERYEIVKNQESGTGAEVDLSFVPITIVKVATAATPITTEPVAVPIKPKGKKDPQPVDPASLKSVSANMADAAASALGF